MRSLMVLAFALLMSCNNNGPTSPETVAASLPHGRLAGIVTIGPNCPGPETNPPCTTPADAYALRKIEVYDATHNELLHTVDIDSRGAYAIELVPAQYTIDLKKNGIDKTSDLPVKVTIQANVITPLNVNIDTGIR